MSPWLPRYSVNTCLTCKSPKPLSSSKCSLILEDMPCFIPFHHPSLLIHQLLTLYLSTNIVIVILCTRKLKDHAYFRLAEMPLMTGTLDVKSRDTQWGFEFSHSVIINIIMSNPEAALFKESCTVFLIDLHLFSD